MVKKLSRMPYAQAKVVIDEDGTIYLISYRTTVIIVEPDGFCTCTGTYSPTTRKHIGAFAHEYLSPLCYQDLRDAFNGGYKINHETGEIIMI